MKNLYSFAAHHYLKIFAGILFSLPVTAKAQESMRVNLYVMDASGNVLVDGNLTNYNNIYSNAVDINDAWKITNPGINFGIVREGYNLVVERRSIIGRNDTTFFKMWNLPQYTYQMKFMLKNLNHPNLTAFLKDSYKSTQTAIALNDTTYVNFTVNSDANSSSEKRFQLIFKTAPPAPVDVDFARVDAQRNGKDVMLEWAVMNEVTVESYVVEYSTDGVSFNELRQQQADNSVALTTYNYEYPETSTGDLYYRIKALNTGGKVQYSRTAKVDALVSTTSIDVYPNPVMNKTVQVKLNNLPAGNYSVVLLYNNGSRQQLKTMQANGNQSLQTINLPQQIASGVYQLMFVCPGKPTITKVISVL